MSVCQIRDVVQFHAEAQVGFVRSETLHGLDPRHAAEGLRKVDAENFVEHVFCPALEYLEYILLLDERHLAVYLREFGLTVCTQVLVAEAAYDLEVTVVTGNHEQLLERLG